MHPSNPIWRRRNWQLWIRHDADRFLTPAGQLEAKRAREAEAARRAREAEAAAQEAFDREMFALRASHERVRMELAEVKFALALRRISHKYRPDQPRDDRGRWVDDPNQGNADDAAKVGSEAAFSPNQFGWHNYRAGPNAVGTAASSREEMADQLARYSLPGRDPSMPIEDGQTYPVHVPGATQYVGDVETRIEDDGLTIQNRTKQGHIFFDGMVVRQLGQTPDGTWFVTTYGLGNNVEPGMNVVNQLVGPEVFGELDRQMRANIERHHGKGFLDLARDRVVGRDRARTPHALLGER